jgi:undecaprenyl-diphosphatase
LHFIEAIILGLIQGLTEFIPVSSSGHLIIIPKLLGWKDMGLTFDVALHLGTVIALIAFFWRDWVKIITQFYSHVVKRKDYIEMEAGGSHGRQMIPIIIACVPAALVGYKWNDYIEETLRNPYIVIIPMVVVGLVMLLGEKLGRRNRPMGQMTYKDYIIIGLAQAMALFPGVSRSGATITAGLFLNLEREAAARFSFLMSMPIIVAAALLQFYKNFLKVGVTSSELAVFAVGLITAAISGYLAIRFLMNFVQKRSLAAFAIYRFAFAVLVLLIYRP